LKKRDHKEDLYIDETILKWILEKEDEGGVVWIHLAKDRDQWQALVNTVMNLWVP
jgi:hypothetical protein